MYALVSFNFIHRHRTLMYKASTLEYSTPQIRILYAKKIKLSGVKSGIYQSESEARMPTSMMTVVEFHSEAKEIQ